MQQSTARAGPRGISRLLPGDETSPSRVAYPARVIAKAANGVGLFSKMIIGSSVCLIKHLAGRISLERQGLTRKPRQFLGAEF